jgi:hypothetical protein
MGQCIVSNKRPQHLPFCIYPSAEDVDLHGVQQLPEELPIVDLKAVQHYRSNQYDVISVETLDPSQVVELVHEIALSFSKRSPLARHVVPPKYPPDGLQDAEHTDEFGTEKFGSWTSANIIYWLFRLFVLTDPTSPASAVETQRDVLEHSLAILDDNGQVIAGALRETRLPPDENSEFRQNDLFLKAVLSFIGPLLEILANQAQLAISALVDKYPAFRDAYYYGKVGNASFVARTDAFPSEHAFELVATTIEHFQAKDYQFVVTQGANQWTGAAYEALNGVRVHFQPYQAEKILPESQEPVEGMTTSPNGFISDKDSGSMFYIVRLK